MNEHKSAIFMFNEGFGEPLKSEHGQVIYSVIADNIKRIEGQPTEHNVIILPAPENTLATGGWMFQVVTKYNPS